jgi:hypothetical protein
LKEKILRRLKEVTQGGLAVCQPSKHEAMIQTLVPPKKKKEKERRTLIPGVQQMFWITI